MIQTKQILLIDDDRQLLEVLARQARHLGLHVFTAETAEAAAHVIEHNSLDLICVDIEIANGDGLEIVSAIAPEIRMPLVVLTGLTDEATRKRCARLGAHFLCKGNDLWTRLKLTLTRLLDVDVETPQAVAEREVDSSPPNPASLGSLDITERVFELLGTSESFLDLPLGMDCSELPAELPAEPSAVEPWVLCIEDDQDFSLALQLRLKQHGISVVRAFEGVEGLQAALTRPAEAIILDYNLPNGRGDYVLRRLKANPLTRDIPVIVVSGQKHPGLEKEMLHLGATRFFAKPARFEELLEELRNHIPVNV